MDVLEALDTLRDDRLKSKCVKAMAAVERSLDLYGPAGIAFSFNGGKDSTVLLHLIRAAVVKWRRQQGTCSVAEPAGLGGISTFFFHNDKDFPEITEFTHRVNKEYGLGMEILYGDFKAGLISLLGRTSVQAIVLGTRKVNPILDWSYHDVWTFLRLLQAPYCALYDRGYTSIGSVQNTQPNSALVKEDGTFAPAHLLPDARLERAGRVGGNLRRTDTLGADAMTAALVIIGDEILSAKVEDVNARFLCAELRAIGWQVCRVVVLRDDVEAIAAEVKALSERHNVVITSGGLGPTVDDVTMQAVAAAFDSSLTRHPELEVRLRRYFGGDVTEAHLKMAETPTGSEVALIEQRLDSGEVSPFPLLRCRNVFVLPGIPTLLQKKWKAVREQLLAEAGKQTPFRTVLLRLGIADETQVASALEQVAAAAGDEVAVGSYPVDNQSDGARLVLSLESKNSERLEQSRQLLLRLLPHTNLMVEQRDCDELSSPVGHPQRAPSREPEQGRAGR